MTARIAVLALLLLSSSIAASVDVTDRRLELIDPAKVRQLGHYAARLHLIDYPDGGFIADIGGRRLSPITLRPGTMVTINGRGFAARAPASNVGLFNGPATTGMFLNIVSWTDTRVVVLVPCSADRPFPATNQARMILQGVKPGGIWSRYEVKPIRFVRP